MYSSKKAMKKHEKGEGSKMRAMEMKMGVKDVVKSAKGSKGKATVVRKKMK